MEIQTERVQIPLEGGGSMGGYLARPAGGGSHPGVLVNMEIFGVNSHIRDVTERVAREGYVALAFDYFHRTGPGVEYGYDDEGMAKGMQLLGALVADEMISDSKAALAFLRARDDVRSDRIGAIGFCIGGHMTYLQACTTDIQASASYYGGGIAGPQGPGGAPSTVSRTPGIQGRIVCYFGAKDGMIPPDQVTAVRGALEKAKVSHEVVVYEGADHGFNCDKRGTYQKKAADAAWEKTKQLFHSELQA